MENAWGQRPAGTPGYAPLQIVLHWTIAALVVIQLFFNGAIEVAFDARMDGDAAAHGFVGQAMAWGHIVIGSTILALALWRLTLRLSIGAPEPAMPAPRVVVFMAHLAHVALYAFIIVTPLTGLAAWVLKLDLAAEMHEWLRWPFVLLLIGHVVGAIVEHSVFGNATLMRMLRPGSPRQKESPAEYRDASHR